MEMNLLGLINALGTVIATLGIAVATILLWKATDKMARNTIRPWMFARASNQEERQETFSRGRELEKSKRKGIDPKSLIDTSGIHVENSGLGPATVGEIYLIREDGKKELIDKFTRIYQGHRYLYPSPDRPDFRITKDTEKVRIGLIYHDMNGKEYKWEGEVYFRGEKVEAP